MIVYPAIFGASLIGIIALIYRRFMEARALPEEKLKSKLSALPSVRSDIWDRFLAPAAQAVRRAAVVFFWRASDALVGRVRQRVIKMETHLEGLSKKIHGRAVNLDVPEKSEYWQNLNGAKNGKNGEHRE